MDTLVRLDDMCIDTKVFGDLVGIRRRYRAGKYEVVLTRSFTPLQEDTLPVFISESDYELLVETWV